MKQYPFIDGLRAVAVIPVILFHFGAGAVTGGFAGVDVFFVLSGFLITGVLLDMCARDAFSLATFYERRARRILPALFMMGLLCLGFCWVYFMPDDFRNFGHSLYGVALFASNVIFYEKVGYFASPALTNPLLHTWSLAVEEQFYLLYPLVLYALHRRQPANPRRLVRWVAAMFMFSLLLNLCFITSSPHATFYLLHARAWELLAGALAWLCLKDRRGTRAAAELAGFAGVALLAYTFIAYDTTTPFPGAAALAPVVGTVLILWANLQADTLIGKALSLAPVRFIGLISYGMYLYHWPLLVFARYYLDRELTAPETWVLFACVSALAIVSYYLVEQPIRRRRIVVSRRAIFGISLAGLIALGIAGSVISGAKGFPQRFTGPVLQYMTDIAAPPEDCKPLGDSPRGRQRQCSMGAAGSDTDFILWGDSHAHAIAPGLDAAAKEKHLTGAMLWSPGCPPLLGFDHLSTEKYTCAEDSARALKFIAAAKPSTVFLVARWDVVLGGAEPGGIEAIRTMRGPFTKLVGSDTYDLDALAVALRDTVHALEALHIRVVLVKQVPSHLHAIPSALAKDAYLGRDTHAHQRPVGEILARRAPIDAVMGPLRNPSLTILDPVTTFCTNGWCIVEDHDRALYRDASHLSVYGARWASAMWQGTLPAPRR